MLLRESNDHRRTDLATQQRIQLVGSGSNGSARVSSERVPSEREKAGAGIHAGLEGRSHSCRQPSDGGDPAQTDAHDTEQGEQVLVPEPAGGDRGQDPGDTDRGSILPCDHATFHGQPWLARDNSEQSGGLAFAVPALERSYSGIGLILSAYAGCGSDEPASDGEAEPDDAEDAAELPAQDPVHLVSPSPSSFHKTGISREEAREGLTTTPSFAQDDAQGGSVAVERG